MWFWRSTLKNCARVVGSNNVQWHPIIRIFCYQIVYFLDTLLWTHSWNSSQFWHSWHFNILYPVRVYCKSDNLNLVDIFRTHHHSCISLFSLLTFPNIFQLPSKYTNITFDWSLDLSLFCVCISLYNCLTPSRSVWLTAKTIWNNLRLSEEQSNVSIYGPSRCWKVRTWNGMRMRCLLWI